MIGPFLPLGRHAIEAFRVFRSQVIQFSAI